MRKPQTLEIHAKDVCLHVYNDPWESAPEHINVDINATFYNDSNKEPKRLRKIAKWLLKAADYMDYKAKLKE